MTCRSYKGTTSAASRTINSRRSQHDCGIYRNLPVKWLRLFMAIRKRTLGSLISEISMCTVIGTHLSITSSATSPISRLTDKKATYFITETGRRIAEREREVN